MDTLEAIKARRSVRSYDSRPVPEDVLATVLEAGRIAPSANNYQPWHFIVVTDPAKRKGLSEGRWAGFLTESPVVIVGCGNKKKSPEWFAVDTTIALQTMVLAATNEGLGTCWIGSFYPDRVAKLLNVPDDFEVVAMLALGYPKDEKDLEPRPVGRRRKPSEDIISYEQF